jgi:transcriptional regulator with GAF, ATPase, and Fis domain
VRAGAFREDLYFRLNVFPIAIPPLRERPEDIPLLVKRFVAELRRKLGKPLESVCPASLRRLQGYGWPGNVRELQNVIERAAILADSPVIEVSDLLIGSATTTPPSRAQGGTLSLKGAERDHILGVLEQTAWTLEGPGGAAALLGLAPSTLRSKMQRLGIARQA